MNHVQFGCLLAILVAESPVCGQPIHQYPLEYPVQVSSTFGTHRITHHHAGLDLTTDGRETVPVLASADGEIIRIRRRSKGYGRSVYMRHSDGSMTVYAHLSAFGPLFNSLLKSRPRVDSIFDFNIPLGTPIKVKAGDTLGWVGTSGTDLVHLHYELRKGGLPVNPLTNGLILPDTIPPKVTRVIFRPLDYAAHVNDSNDEFVWTEEMKMPFAVDLGGRVGLLVEVTDYIDGGKRKLVPRSIQFEVDGKTIHHTLYETTSYSLKGHTERDYDARLKAHKKGIFHRLFKVKGPKLFVHKVAGQPLDVLKNGTHLGRIKAQDAAGLSGEIDFELRIRKKKTTCQIRSQNLPQPPSSTSKSALELRGNRLFWPLDSKDCENGVGVDVLLNGKRTQKWTVANVKARPTLVLEVSSTRRQSVDISIQRPGGEIHTVHAVTEAGGVGQEIRLRPFTFRFPAKSRFEAYPMAVYPKVHPKAGDLIAESPLYQMANGWARAGRAGRVVMEVPEGISQDGLALFLHDDGQWWYLGQKIKDRKITGHSVHMTGFSLMRDVVNPKIGIPRIEQHPAGPRLIWPASDSGSGIREIRLEIDGRRVAHEWQSAFSRVLFLPIHPPSPGAHTLVLTAIDRLGNRSRSRVNLCWPTGNHPPCTSTKP